MRVFFVVKAIQIINSCVIVALLLGEYRLCGKATVDRVLSRPGSSCMQFIQNSFSMKTLSLSKSNYGRRYHNKIAISNEHLENKTIEVSNSSKNSSADVDYEEMITFSENFEIYSCVTLNLNDPNCFSRSNLRNKPACQTVFGLAFPIFIVILDFMYLIYTIISTSHSIAPPRKKTDFARCAIHILFWCITSFSIIYLLYTWELIWKYSDFKPKVSKQFFMVMIFSVVNVIFYCLEMFYAQWLYVRIRVFNKPDNVKRSRRRSQAGNEVDQRIADLILQLIASLNLEGYVLVPVGQEV